MVDSRFRKWICTLNNPTVSLEDLYNIYKPNYITGQLEKGKNGTLHLQFSMSTKVTSFNSIKKLFPSVHLEGVKNDNGVDLYCNKEDTRVDGPWEYGVKPFNRNSKLDWDQIYLNAKRGNFDAIPSDIKIRCYSNLKKIEKDSLTYYDSPDVAGVWIVGVAGIGKSRLAREKYPNSYLKLCNQWWDGYQNEKSVIMDDLGPEHKHLGYNIKIWGDRYGCNLETKGGMLSRKFDHFIITSQYMISEIFDDIRLIEALKRRFTYIKLK